MTGKIAKISLFIIICAIIGSTVFFLRKSGTIDVVNPVHGPAVEAVYATGTVEPTVMMPIAPRNPSRLLALLADEGWAVKKGQILAQLEDEDLQKTLMELQAKTDLAQKAYDRKAVLVKSGAVSKESLDSAKADLDMAKAAVERAQVNLDYMKLLAPADGRIIRREGEVGQLIPANQPVFWLTCCAGLRVSAEVDEEDIARVTQGQRVIIHADAFPDEIFEGHVQSITPKGDPVARSYRVRIGLALDVKLMIGMTAEANIIVREEKDALLVPASAVSNGSVLLLRNGAAQMQKVKVGARTPEVIEIESGLGEDDLILLNAAQEVKLGQKIRTLLKSWKVP